MKICTKCKITKDEKDFSKSKNTNDGLQYNCKKCVSEYDKSHSRKNKDYYKNNKMKVLKKAKEYYENNKEVKLKYRKEYYEKNKFYILEKAKEYQERNKEHIRKYKRDQYRINRFNLIKKQIKYYRDRYKTDIIFSLNMRIRSLIRHVITNGGYKKSSQTAAILGCTFEEFKLHIEKQFTDGMTWDNRHLWHLDHIYPVSRAVDEQHLLHLNHYTNFQPLWAEENLKKGNKLT